MSESILSIDVSSELEALCESQLRGTWQVPAELVRMAVRLGAGEVRVDRHRSDLVISWYGPLVEGDVLRHLHTALNEKADPDDRQRSIAALENLQMEALLWAAGLRGARIRITAAGRWQQTVFEHRRRRSRWTRNHRSIGQDTVEIAWRCPGLERRRALRWLAVATRFAPIQVLIGGAPGPRNFAGGLFHARIRDPVPCRLGLTRSGDVPVLWLLRDGVVSARATIPGYPPFEAAVELRDHVAPGASAADMRCAVTPYLENLVDRAVWMMVEVSGRVPEMDPADGERLCLMLLRAAHKGLRAREIRHLALVPDARADRWLSVEEIRELAKRSAGVLPVVDRAERLRGDPVDPGSTVRASSEIRDVLSELAGVRFQSPTLRRRGFSRRCVEWIGLKRARVLRRMRGLLAGRKVSPGELQAQEETVLTAARSALSPIEVQLHEGRGKAGRVKGRVVVPRSSSAMISGAKFVAEEPVWIYPLLLALDTGCEAPEHVRQSWLDTVAGEK
jgi:hypothetical protein